VPLQPVVSVEKGQIFADKSPPENSLLVCRHRRSEKECRRLFDLPPPFLLSPRFFFEMAQQTSFQIYRLDGGGKNPMLVNQISTLGDEHVGGDLYVAGDLHVSGETPTGLTEVSHDETLSGEGTSASPLKVVASDSYWRTATIGGETVLENTGTGYVDGYETYTGGKRIDAAEVDLVATGAVKIVAPTGIGISFTAATDGFQTITGLDYDTLSNSVETIPTSAAVQSALPTTYWQSATVQSMPVIALKSGVYAVAPQTLIFTSATDLSELSEYWVVTCEASDDGTNGSQLEIAHKVPGGGDDGTQLIMSSDGTITLGGEQLVTSAKVPNPPAVDATYVLTATVSGGVPTYSWTAK
jgi:hypothetical protein